MNLLAGTLYDPAVSVSKATTALLALTAIDTTNLRLTFTVPLSGRAYVRVSGGALHGAATYPVILVGILSGASVVARHQPIITVNGAAAATTPGQVFAEFVVTGLTPGASLTWDLAYAVEAIVAATGWKYGGPNTNVTAGDAWGGVSFTIWDPAPIYLPTAMPTATAHAKLDLIDDFVDTEVAAILAAVDTEVGAIKTTTDKFVFTTANKVDATLNAAGDFPQACADKAWSTAARTLTASLDPTAAQIRAEMDSNSVDLDAIIAFVDALELRLTAARALLLDNLDVAVSTRGTSTYAGGAVASVTGAVGSVAAGGIAASAFAVGAVDAAALATDAVQEIADALLDRANGVETGLTPRQALRLCAAVLAGVVSGAATTTITIRNAVADSKARVTATVDADGNRPSIIYDLT